MIIRNPGQNQSYFKPNNLLKNLKMICWFNRLLRLSKTLMKNTKDQEDGKGFSLHQISNTTGCSLWRSVP